jgi:hypothetical protein
VLKKEFFFLSLVGFIQSPAKEKKAARRRPVKLTGRSRSPGGGGGGFLEGRWGRGLYGARVEGTVGGLVMVSIVFWLRGELDVTGPFLLRFVLVSRSWSRFRLIADSEECYRSKLFYI